ncbi:hypothetical protein PBI_HILLTOPFARM_99 [Mycobacterium phage Hilltopfarm]|nr:hypothetical protein PBI_HILLTOPFARM_99 [Mycobacterium phage Hilltopfarm]
MGWWIIGAKDILPQQETRSNDTVESPSLASNEGAEDQFVGRRHEQGSP